MNPVEFWLAIFAVLGVVVVAPAWMYFVGPGLSGVPFVVQWLVALTLPIGLLITIASWVDG